MSQRSLSPTLQMYQEGMWSQNKMVAAYDLREDFTETHLLDLDPSASRTVVQISVVQVTQSMIFY